MLYLPETIDVPACERCIIETYIKGNMPLCIDMLADLPKEKRKLVYILELIEYCAEQRPSLTFQGKTLALAGASHCISPAWTNLSIGDATYIVKPYYYLDLAISTFTMHKDNVVDFLTSVVGDEIIITCGGLDLYQGGRFNQMTRTQMSEYCRICVEIISLVKPEACLMPILPSADISHSAYCEVNNLLNTWCSRLSVRLLSPQSRCSLTAIDSRHFSYEYLSLICAGMVMQI